MLRYNAKTSISTRSPVFFEYSQHLLRNRGFFLNPSIRKEKDVTPQEALQSGTLFVYACDRSCDFWTGKELVVPFSNQMSTSTGLVNCPTTLAPYQSSHHWHSHFHPDGSDQCKFNTHSCRNCFNLQILKDALNREEPSPADAILIGQFCRIGGTKFLGYLTHKATSSQNDAEVMVVSSLTEKREDHSRVS